MRSRFGVILWKLLRASDHTVGAMIMMLTDVHDHNGAWDGSPDNSSTGQLGSLITWRVRQSDRSDSYNSTAVWYARGLALLEKSLLIRLRMQSDHVSNERTYADQSSTVELSLHSIFDWRFSSLMRQWLLVKLSYAWSVELSDPSMCQTVEVSAGCVVRHPIMSTVRIQVFFI